MPAVQPDEPTCRMDDIASFRPGVQNGVPYTAEMLKAAVKNYVRFSQTNPPHYIPYLSINHDDGFAFGRISEAKFDDATGVLKVSGENIPLTVGKLVNSGQLQAPSIEFFLPMRDQDGKVVDGFRDENNNVVDTMVIKALTFLGNQPPAVKGLGPLPTAYFSDRFGGCKLAKFSGVFMDRNAMLEALKAAGFPTDTVTDVVPDEVLKAILDTVQMAAKDETVPEAEFMDDDSKDDDGKDKKMVPPGMSSEDHAVGDGSSSNQSGQRAAMWAKDPEGDGIGSETTMTRSKSGKVSTGKTRSGAETRRNSDRSHGVVRFADETGRIVTGTLQDFVDSQQAVLKGLSANAKAIQRDQAARLSEMKKSAIKVFLDEMCSGTQARLAPVQRPTFEKLLMKCDHVAVKKFSDGAQGTGTELEDMMRSIRSGPVVRTFGDKFADSMSTPGVKMTPERRKELLGYTEEGRVVVARQKQGK